jgi:hypothetical protein
VNLLCVVTGRHIALTSLSCYNCVVAGGHTALISLICFNCVVAGGHTALMIAQSNARTCPPWRWTRVSVLWEKDATLDVARVAM